MSYLDQELNLKTKDGKDINLTEEIDNFMLDEGFVWSDTTNHRYFRVISTNTHTIHIDIYEDLVYALVDDRSGDETVWDKGFQYEEGNFDSFMNAYKEMVEGIKPFGK